MVTKLNGLILPNKVIDKMKNFVDTTKTTKVELGFSLCKEEDSDIIKDGSECTGTVCSVKIRPGCFTEKETYLGNFHTHPTAGPTMSSADMSTSCSTGISCVGSAKTNEIKCYLRETDPKSCSLEVEPLKRQRELLDARTETINELLKSSNVLIKPGLTQLIKTITQQQIEMREYDIRKKEILEKNFKEINVR